MARHESDMHRRLRTAEERLKAIANQLVKQRAGGQADSVTLDNIALTLRLAGYKTGSKTRDEADFIEAFVERYKD